MPSSTISLCSMPMMMINKNQIVRATLTIHVSRSCHSDFSCVCFFISWKSKGNLAVINKMLCREKENEIFLINLYDKFYVLTYNSNKCMVIKNAIWAILCIYPHVWCALDKKKILVKYIWLWYWYWHWQRHLLFHRFTVAIYTHIVSVPLSCQTWFLSFIVYFLRRIYFCLVILLFLDPSYDA